MTLRTYLLMPWAHSDDLKSTTPEGWNDNSIWYHPLDSAFLNVPWATSARGGLASHAVSEDANANRYETGRGHEMKSNYKLDSIFRTSVHFAAEYGVVEAAKQYDGEHATKALEDGAKVCLVLRDMLVRLQSKVPKGKEDLIPHIQTVGIITAGCYFRVIRY